VITNFNESLATGSFQAQLLTYQLRLVPNTGEREHSRVSRAGCTAAEAGLQGSTPLSSLWHICFAGTTSSSQLL